MSGYVRLLGQGLVSYIAGGCGFTYRYKNGCGRVWADMGKGGKRWALVRLNEHVWVTYLAGGCERTHRSRGRCGQV